MYFEFSLVIDFLSLAASEWFYLRSIKRVFPSSPKIIMLIVGCLVLFVFILLLAVFFFILCCFIIVPLCFGVGFRSYHFLFFPKESSTKWKRFSCLSYGREVSLIIQGLKWLGIWFAFPRKRRAWVLKT
jgi:hypothetical protein